MTLETLRGSEHLIKPRKANNQSHLFLLLVEYCAKLRTVDISNHSTEGSLVQNVFVHTNTVQVRRWIGRWHHFSS